MNTDVLLEKLSMTLPLGLGRAHAKIIGKLLDGETGSCLDVGCGRGAFPALRKRMSIGVDIYAPNLAIARDKGIYRDVLQCDVRKLPFAPRSFDNVICIEVIEHLGKAEGTALLRQIEKIARRQVIITTPWGYCPLDEREDNPHLNHLSGWFPEEFTRAGYEVRPFYYPRFPAGNKTGQVIARYALSPVLYPWVRANPRKWALDFVAVKRMG
jgi:SAM-dependent methyltransferase